MEMEVTPEKPAWMEKSINDNSKQKCRLSVKNILLELFAFTMAIFFLQVYSFMLAELKG